MEIGIVGLSQCGKTTVFNALSKGSTDTNTPYSSTKPNLGTAKVHDSRLKPLEEMFRPKKTVAAEIKYIDFPNSHDGLSHTNGISGAFLNALQGADAILQVVRAFHDPSVPHVDGSVDPYRDILTMNLELAFADLAILERRVERLENELKGAKSHEKDGKLREHATLARIKSALEEEIPIREQHLSADESKLLQNFQFLTQKPMLIVWNTGEEQTAQASDLEENLKLLHSSPWVAIVAFCAKLEMDLMDMGDEEATEFRIAMDLQEPGLYRAVRASYALLGLISFFTVGSDEVRAWTIDLDTPALKAAGKIHTDIERGFIRADVISYEHLSECGSISEGKKRGLFRLEGKTYKVQDGDIINFLFNV